MKLTAESELMKNQKHAEVMAPDLAFEALQTPEGDALFFSIGTDGTLYVTRQLRDSQTGWNKVDLSSGLAALHDNAAVIAKSFAVSQEPQTLMFNLLLVLTVNSTDFLYMSLNHDNKAETWASPIVWTLIPFDADSVVAPAPFTIADVYLLNIPSASGPGHAASQNCFVDILRDPSDSMQLLDRYFIRTDDVGNSRTAPSSGPAWVSHTLAADLTAGSISSCLGHRTGDHVPGIYTFGTIGKTQELLYAPQYNYFNPSTAPNSARLTLPSGSTCVSSALDAKGNTNLFVAATDGLHVFKPEKQGDKATSVLIIPASGSNNNKSLLVNLRSLAAVTSGSKTVIWGVSAQQDLFYAYCVAGSEAVGMAWSAPVPICSGVEHFAFYLNTGSANNVVFAHLSAQNMLQITQNPATGVWSQRSITLPPTKSDDILHINAFTTQIKVSDDNGVGIPQAQIHITSTSPVSVYVNDIYRVLGPSIVVDVTANATGSVTIIQETQGLSAVQYKASTMKSPQISVSIDPASKAMERLSAIQSGDDLGKVQIQLDDQDPKPLVPDSVSASDTDDAAKAIAHFLTVKNTLPADGSVASPTLSSTHGGLATKPQRVTLWGASCGKGGFKYHTGSSATHGISLSEEENAHERRSVKSFDDFISIGAGDLWNAIESGFGAVDKFLVEQEGNIYSFVATIAGKVYKAILSCVSDVVGAIEFVLKQIEVLIEEIIAWLGFLFGWKDIIRTHRVIKNIAKVYARYAVDSMASWETKITETFDAARSQVNTWAAPSAEGPTIASQKQSASSVSGVNSPQSNWAMYHFNNGAPTASTSTSDPVASGSSPDLLQKLGDLAGQQQDSINDIIVKIKKDIIDQAASLTFVDVSKKVMALISDAFLKGASELFVALIEVLKTITSGLTDVLEADIDIPIISWIYKLITGDDLSILDVVCLIAAIPVTIIYKIATNNAPFPDDDHTSALMGARDFTALRNLLSGQSKVKQTSARASRRASPSNPSGPQQLLRASAEDNEDEDDPTPSVDAATVALDIAGLPGSMIVSAIQAIEMISRPSEKSAALRFLSVAGYLLYAAPNYPPMWEEVDVWEGAVGDMNWATRVNEVVTGFSIIKTLADNLRSLSESDVWKKASPILESLINLTWVVPACGSIKTSHSKASDVLGFMSNMYFDFGGMLVGPAAFTEDPAWKLILEGGVLACTLDAGLYDLAAGIAVAAGH